VNTKTRYIFHQLTGNSIEEYIKILAEIKKAKMHNYFVFGSIDTLNKVIEAVNMLIKVKKIIISNIISLLSAISFTFWLQVVQVQ